MENCKIINVTKDDIPSQYFNKTYAYLSFSIWNDKLMHLYLAMDLNDHPEFLILDLRDMKSNDKSKMREFLSSICIEDKYHLNLKPDIAIAKSRFEVHLKVKRVKKEIV